MKKEFSTSWNGSKQPRKQRKYVAKAPMHIRRDFMSSHLSKELRQKYSRRSFPIRKGDNVKIMKGENKGKTGKISIIDMKNLRVAIEGLQLTKKEGSKVNIWIRPSNLMILELTLDDKKRMASLNKGKNKEAKK